MALNKRETELVREMATVISALAIRAEREHPQIARDETLIALLDKASTVLWQAYERIEPVPF